MTDDVSARSDDDMAGATESTGELLGATAAATASASVCVRGRGHSTDPIVLDGSDRSRWIGVTAHRPKPSDWSDLDTVGATLAYQPIYLVVIMTLECCTPTIDGFAARIITAGESQILGNARNAFHHRIRHVVPPVAIRRNQGPEQRSASSLALLRRGPYSSGPDRTTTLATSPCRRHHTVSVLDGERTRTQH